MIISYDKIKKYKNLSSSQLEAFNFKNKNIFKLSQLLYRNLQTSDNGIEVGSINYIKKSEKIFMKAKALQAYNYLPVINAETSEFIKPNCFVNMELLAGDIILSKDSNIGETCILDKDYSNVMLSNALYKLPIKKNKLYIFSFMKSSYFKKQLDILSPRGATIRHAGKRFLDCYIPFPNSTEVINFIECLTKSIIDIEKNIYIKNDKILNYFDNNLKDNCIIKKNCITALHFSEVKNIGRLDVGIFSESYKKINYYIENYRYGYRNLEELGYKISRGQNLQISNIGKSIYTKNKINEDYYQLILSNSITDYMSFRTEEYLGSKKKLKEIEYGDIIFTCRGNLGRCFINCSESKKMITNIDNVHISNKSSSIEEKITIGCYLHYLKHNNYLKNISIQGSGADSFTKYHFDMIKVPNFPVDFQKDIYDIYCSKIRTDFDINNISSSLSELGLFQLEKAKEIIKKYIDFIFSKIVNDEFINIERIFLDLKNELILL